MNLFSDIKMASASFCTMSKDMGMNSMMAFFTSSRPSSTSPRNLLDTDLSASSGHFWNQSMVVQFTSPGNLRALTLRFSPTGLKHSETCRFFLIRVKKNLYTLSLSGFPPGFSALNGLVNAATILSISSSGNRPLISPLDKRSLIYTMNFSSMI